MTICIAAIAAKGDQIVCVADRMMSFGDIDQVQWDSNVTKILPVFGGRIICLFAGSFSVCETLITQLLTIEDLGEDAEKTRSQVEKTYGELFAKYQTLHVLTQRGINAKTYEAMLKSGKDGYVIRDTYQAMESYSLDCDIMLCGYDRHKIPFIISVASPGVASDHKLEGHYTIGIASQMARTRLLWSGYDTDHPFGRVLFDCFDAKATAEMVPSVGREWDAYVLSRDMETHVVPKTTKRDLIEAGWDNHFKSPFDEWNADEYLPSPGDGWEGRVLRLSLSDLEPLTKDQTHDR